MSRNRFVVLIASILFGSMLIAAALLYPVLTAVETREVEASLIPMYALDGWTCELVSWGSNENSAYGARPGMALCTR